MALSTHLHARVVREEVANSVTHGVGTLLAVAGVAVLMTLAAVRGTAWHVVSCSVFGASLVLRRTVLRHSADGVTARSDALAVPLQQR